MHQTLNKVILITGAYFWRGGVGFWARTREMVKFLSTNSNLTVIFINPIAPQCVEVIDSFKHYFPLEFISESNSSYNSREAYLFSLRKLINNLETDADIFIIDKTENSYLIDALPEDSFKIVDMHDMISSRTEKLKDRGIEDEFVLTKKQEAFLLSKYDRVICIQEEEYEQVKDMINEDKALLVPHPVTIKKPIVRQYAQNIGFVASGWHANIEGLRFFIDKVWPLLKKHRIKLNVFGYVCNDIIVEDENILLHGYNPDIDECYSKLDVFINPVNYGAGLKLKTVEAMSYGLPLVTTAEGASGLTHLNKSCLLIAENANDFGDRIRELLNSYQKRKYLSENAQNYVNQHFNHSACFKDLLDVIKS